MNTNLIKVGNFVMIESQPVKIVKVINRKTGEVILENNDDVFTITNQEIASNKPDSEDLPEGKISNTVPAVTDDICIPGLTIPDMNNYPKANEIKLGSTPDISDLDQQIINKIIAGTSEEEIDSDIQKSVNNDYQNLIVLHEELENELRNEKNAHEALKLEYTKLQAELATCKNQLSIIAQLKTTTPIPVITPRIVIKNDIID